MKPDNTKQQNLPAQLCLLISDWTGLCDREPERADKAAEMIGI